MAIFFDFKNDHLDGGVLADVAQLFPDDIPLVSHHVDDIPSVTLARVAVLLVEFYFRLDAFDRVLVAESDDLRLGT